VRSVSKSPKVFLKQQTTEHFIDTMSLPNLTKREIVNEVFNQTGIPQKHVRDAVQLTLDAIVKAVSEGRNVELRNFGVFEVQIRQPRIGRNPNKPEWEVQIPERAVVKFKAGKELKAFLQAFDAEKIKAVKEAQGKARRSVAK
jgi:nucleoid DNA-binding protein